ncbi:MAG: FISUMP domain-containing protein, partial [Bacteroidota bacterium]|nr:FISUMP domain-containing protein [Bacteroidota bacterium]
ATGKVWMDKNLGASQVADSSNDYNAYGALFQWGRLSDGHECITWTNSTTGTPDNGTTSTNSSSDDPGHSLFITEESLPYDWRSPQNDNLWQGVSGTNNPCPSGYRLPTETELNNERASWSSNDAAGAYGSPLKLPVAGERAYSNGSLANTGSYGFYWSSTVYCSIVRILYFFSSNAHMDGHLRASGISVRCIKD